MGKSGKNLVILTLAMFAAGIFLLAWGVYEIKGSQEAGSWPSAPGTIVSSHVREQATRDTRTRRQKTVYYPSVQYRYQAEGRPYTGNRIQFGGESGGLKTVAQKVVARYPAGKTVTVHYNPQDPQYAVLESGFSWGNLILPLVGIGFLGAGVLCLRALLRNKHPGRSAGPP